MDVADTDVGDDRVPTESFVIDVDVPLAIPDYADVTRDMPPGHSDIDGHSEKPEQERPVSRSLDSDPSPWDDAVPSKPPISGSVTSIASCSTTLARNGAENAFQAITPQDTTIRHTYSNEVGVLDDLHSSAQERTTTVVARTRPADLSRPTSRCSKTSSFIDVADQDFLTRYKELKLRLKEKETEISRLENDAIETQAAREMEMEILNKPKPLFVWQKKKEPVVEVVLLDPAAILRKMWRRRIMTLVAIGVALAVLPVIAVLQLRRLVSTR